MQNFGRTTVSEFLGEWIVYRNLVPVDKRLPPLDVIRREICLPTGEIPRKNEADYARVIVYLLTQARVVFSPEVDIARLIYVGDTRLSDGTAFDNICQAGDWPGLAFIGSETDEASSIDIVQTGTDRILYMANRWKALADFDRFCQKQKFLIDEATAVVVDLDKTTLGARGRNAHVIDQVRVQSVKDTVADLLGENFDETAFKVAYDTLNQVTFHLFTTDNQDYLAYICLILGSGLYDLEMVIGEVQAGRLRSFKQFIAQVDAHAEKLEAGLAAIHKEIIANVQAGDPTPFKSFRRNEYLRTVERMGQMDDRVPVKSLLAEEIVITQEVRELVMSWRERGVLFFGLSDKPDEASIPSAEFAAQGYIPIHQVKTHSVGSS